jgi:hypothetical protein
MAGVFAAMIALGVDQKQRPLASDRGALILCHDRDGSGKVPPGLASQTSNHYMSISAGLIRRKDTVYKNATLEAD